MAEVTVRRLFTDFDFSHAILNIIIVGLVRSIITYIFYNGSLYYKDRYDRAQKESKYREMVLFISRLKTELFFLRKSVFDIEDSMEKSYQLYRDIEDVALKERILTISKNIHEIKKDYYRVTDGMEKVLSEEDRKTSICLREIFDIISENSNKIILARKLDVIFKF
ncbi:hypothetical protein [Alkaliphilus metalliredigens]|uniref:hypothetical protein n=1 Tax=Alkaliphilus metalliredigens TaxID=208226 RepID=UPI0012EE4CF0|nr:hypothetical protein [Alkaliphilus metalliredigens]